MNRFERWQKMKREIGILEYLGILPYLREMYWGEAPTNNEEEE